MLLGIARASMLPVLVACSTERGDAPVDTAADEATTGDSAADASEPVWSPEEAETQLEAALAIGLPDPAPVRAAYREWVAHGDSRCPAWEDPDAPPLFGLWHDDCVTGDGYHFDGQGIYTESGTDADWVVDTLLNFTITAPSGEVFSGYGNTSESAAPGEGTATTWTTLVGGRFHLDGAEGALGGTEEAGMFGSGGQDGDHRWATLEGGAGSAVGDVYLSQVTVDNTVCEGEPLGSVSVRDPGDHWYVVTISDCGGCGPATWHGQPLGELCPGAALAAAVAPLVVAGWSP